MVDDLTCDACLATAHEDAQRCAYLRINGQPSGHPSQALDTACTLYLADTSNPSRTNAELH